MTDPKLNRDERRNAKYISRIRRLTEEVGSTADRDLVYRIDDIGRLAIDESASAELVEAALSGYVLAAARKNSIAAAAALDTLCTVACKTESQKTAALAIDTAATLMEEDAAGRSTFTLFNRHFQALRKMPVYAAAAVEEEGRGFFNPHARLKNPVLAALDRMQDLFYRTVPQPNGNLCISGPGTMGQA